MFSLLNTSNNIDLSQGKNFLQVNKNNEYKLIPNLDLIGSDDNVGSIVEAMSGADSIQANNTVTASNVSKINDEFNQIMIEYIKNYQLLIEQVLKNQSNQLLQKYAGKNVKLQGSENEIFYVTGGSRESILHNPNLEYFKKQGIEVLYLTDQIDDLPAKLCQDNREIFFRDSDITRFQRVFDAVVDDSQHCQIFSSQKIITGILAAKSSGMKEIILSSENKKDVLDINEKYLKGLKFHYIEKMSEVIDLSLLKSKVSNPYIK